jgi:hypothetical protein
MQQAMADLTALHRSYYGAPISRQQQQATER